MCSSLSCRFRWINVQLLEGQDLALASAEELLEGSIWSTHLGSPLPIADGLLEVMQHPCGRLSPVPAEPLEGQAATNCWGLGSESRGELFDYHDEEPTHR